MTKEEILEEFNKLYKNFNNEEYDKKWIEYFSNSKLNDIFDHRYIYGLLWLKKNHGVFDEKLFTTINDKQAYERHIPQLILNRINRSKKYDFLIDNIFTFHQVDAIDDFFRYDVPLSKIVKPEYSHHLMWKIFELVRLNRLTKEQLDKQISILVLQQNN